MIPRDELIDQIKPVLKEKGFKKHNKTWVLDNSETAVVLNIQDSQFGGEYYLNFGTYIKELGNVQIPSISACQIWNRINADFKTPMQVVDAIDLWIEWYGDLQKIHKKISENKMPKTTHQSVFRYFLFEYISDN